MYCTLHKQQSTSTSRNGDCYISNLQPKGVGTRNQNSYEIAGAVYSVYTNAACTTPAHAVGSTANLTLTTTSDGYTGTVQVAEGTYYLKETSASKGFGKDGEVIIATVAAGSGVTTVESWEPPAAAGGSDSSKGVYFAKADRNTKKLQAQGAATLQGAVYKLEHFDVTGDAVGSATATTTAYWTTDASGKIDFSSDTSSGTWLYKDKSSKNVLPIGLYRLTETIASTGYRLNSAAYLFRVNQTGSASAGYGASSAKVGSNWPNITISGVTMVGDEEIQPVTIEISKLDDDQSDRDQGDADVYGAEFQVRLASGMNDILYNGSTIHAGGFVDTVKYDSTTKKWKISGLPFASYVVTESKAPDHYSGTTQSETITPIDGVESYSVTFKNKIHRNNLVILKRDSETDDPIDATFAITNASDDSVTWNGSTYAPNAKMVTVNTTNGSVSVNNIPYGTYMVEETGVRTSGYQVNVSSWTITGSGGEILSSDDTEATIGLHGGSGQTITLTAKDEPIRGDVEVLKTNIYNEPLGGATYTIYNWSGTDIWNNAIGKTPVKTSNGGVICKITTGNNWSGDRDNYGVAKTENKRLRYGTYRIVETTPPRGIRDRRSMGGRLLHYGKRSGSQLYQRRHIVQSIGRQRRLSDDAEGNSCP